MRDTSQYLSCNHLYTPATTSSTKLTMGEKIVLNKRKIKDRITCIHDTNPGEDEQFKKQLEEELQFLERLLRYSEPMISKKYQ